METAIVTALISGGITLIGVLIANNKTQAVMETKVDELFIRFHVISGAL